MAARRSLGGAMRVAAAAFVALVRVPPTMVERVSSTRLYAGLQPLVTSISNLVPFALFDIVVGFVLVAYFALAVRDVVRGRGVWRRLGPIFARAIVWSA